MNSTSERAVLAGGCFWGMQDLLRHYPGVISTRVGYTGGDVPNATYRNHGTHAEALEVIFDPAKLSFRKLLEFFFQIHDPTTVNQQGNDTGASYRSAISMRRQNRRESLKRRSLTSMRLESGPARSLPSLSRWVHSGRLSRNIRIIWRNIPTATHAISSGRIGHCPRRQSEGLESGKSDRQTIICYLPFGHPSKPGLSDVKYWTRRLMR
jgi:methionine-S-sulfoxide reductase